jgi:predicted transposase YdaD
MKLRMQETWLYQEGKDEGRKEGKDEGIKKGIKALQSKP